MPDKIESRPVLSKTNRVEDLRHGLHKSLSRISVRGNLVAPIDGSELIRQVAWSSKTLPLITAQRNDYDIGTDKTVHLLDSDNNYIITGIANGAANDPGTGRVITLINTGIFTFVLTHLHISSLPENRMFLPNKVSYNLLKGSGMSLQYDGALNFWRWS